MAVVRRLEVRAGRIVLWCRVAKRIGWSERVFQGIMREITFQGQAIV